MNFSRPWGTAFVHGGIAVLFSADVWVEKHTLSFCLRDKKDPVFPYTFGAQNGWNSPENVVNMKAGLSYHKLTGIAIGLNKLFQFCE